MNPTATAPAPTTSAQALQGLQQFQQGMKTPQQITQQAQDTSGATQAQQQVQGLQQAIQNTTGLLNRVAPDLMGRTQNSLVTSAQADRQIANEQAPLQSNLTQQQASEQTQAQQLAADQAQAESLANAGITGQQNTLSNLQSIYQDLLGREQEQQRQAEAAAAAAEATRQFNASLAAQQAAARSGGGGGSIGLGGGAGGGGGNTAPAQNRAPADIAASLIQAFRQNPSARAGGWGAAAQFLQSKGIPVTRGTAGDMALNKYFNATGYQQYLDSLRAEHLLK